MTTPASITDLQTLALKLTAAAGSGRMIVALAGAPASGKSTTAEHLQNELTDRHEQTVQIVPMDGFHYDDAVLAQLGRLDRKGAPDTFDVGGLEMTLARLAGAYLTDDIAVPVFDRRLEMSRGSARLIDHKTRILLVEGNYLLATRPPWMHLHQYFDQTVMIACDEATLRHRLLQRWAAFGYTAAEAREKAEGNDLPNARFVIQQSAPAQFVLTDT